MMRKMLVRGLLALAVAGLAALIYLDWSPRTYRFELSSGEGGTIPAGMENVISGEYVPGTKIRLVAREMPGYCFERWVSSDGGEFDDPEDSGAIFVMPGNDVTVTAQFRPSSGSM